MSSQIDPDPVKKATRPPAAQPPAAKPPAKAAATPPKPAAAAAAAPPARRPEPQKAAPPQEAAPPDQEDGEESLGRAAVRQAPAWAISMLVHVVALLGMALIVNEPPKKETPRVITSNAPEVEDEFNEFEDDLPQQETVQTADATADVTVTTEVAVTPVEVVSNATDVDAAPLAVEFTDFGTETAPASDMMAQMGAIGGKGGGIGGRAQAAKLAAAGGGGGDTEQAVDRALKWLAQHQLPDGGWSFDLANCQGCNCSASGKSKAADRCGATAMAILPFLGRGYTHREGPFKPTVERGISFLAQMAVKGNGKAYGAGGSLYSQGLAGIALSECYAMSQDNRLAGPTQLALNFIMQAQDPVGGGWRYSPRQPGDTSAVGWQIMALKSGNMAYLQVNPLTVKKAVDFLNAVQDDDGAFYGYTGPARGPGTTAVGLLCRMYLGWKKDNPALQRGVAYLAKLGPTKDLYFDYYATQIMHHMEGEVWISWNKKMKELLLKNQASSGHEAGSWHEGVNGGHGAEAAGRIYCTALSTMILEVYYRHLPIYRNQSVDEEFKE
ncbi:MAG: terpene cyclase/mutase family protein [Planctomycetia bacterium]|nr:terpene cyclase/mutase family protein [Planctomycetia bacterium]